MTRPAVVALLLFAGALTRSLLDGFGLQDESWFLQVVARARAGDTLYRDVWLGVTPLSVYLTTAISFITGVEIIAVKIATSAAVAAAGVFAWRLGAAAGLTPRFLWWLVPIVIAYGRPSGAPPYTPVAMALFLATAEFALRHMRARVAADRRKLLAIAGVLAGLTFTAKQNVGALAALTIAAAVVLSARELARAGWFAVLITFVVLAPVLIAGAAPSFVDYAFASKTAYLQIGRVSYVGAVTDWLRGALDLASLTSLATTYHGALLMLPVIVAIAGVAAARRSLRTAGAVPLFLTVVAVCAVGAAIPRWDRFHLVYAVPGAAVLVLYALAHESRRGVVSTIAAQAGAVWISAGVLLFTAGSVARLGGANLTWSPLPHFRWTRMETTTLDELIRTADGLRHAASAGPTLILTPEAGALHVLSGIRNVTPFDLPAVTATGRSGAATLAGMIDDGRFAAACVDENDQSPQVLVAVRDAARSRARSRLDLPRCTLLTLESSSAGR